MSLTENERILAELVMEVPDAADLAWDHAMDISGSVYTRIKELGIKKTELARKMGVTSGRISQIIKGDPGMTLKTLARLEEALDFRLDEGFRYQSAPVLINSTIVSEEGKNEWARHVRVPRTASVSYLYETQGALTAA